MPRPWGIVIRSRRTLLWAAVLAISGGILSRQPLFDFLGFPFCLVLALLAWLAGADLGATEVRRFRARLVKEVMGTGSPLALLTRLAGRAAATTFCLLLIPFTTVVLTSLAGRVCDFEFGLACFGALTVSSGAIGAGMGALGATLAGRRKHAAIYAPYYQALILAVWQVADFYRAPPAFFYNQLIGYFPGNLYDERIELHLPLLWSRLGQLAFVGGGLLLCAAYSDVKTLCLSRKRAPSVTRRREAVFGLGALALSLAMLFASSPLGTFHTDDDVGALIGKRHETENFIIYYPPEEEDIALVAEDHEFRLAQVVRDLGVAPTGRITSFYFVDREAKFRAMGALAVQMAKPWRNEIYLNRTPFPHQVLRHELVHAVAARFGSPGLRISQADIGGIPLLINVGLLEGLAVAIDWPNHFTGQMTPHQSVKAMLELGYLPPIHGVMSAGFAFLASSSARSYSTAGSFVRWLYETYGVEKVRLAYERGGDYLAVFGEPLDTLVLKWHRFLDGIELPATGPDIVRERFRRKSVFARPCPHAVARWRSEARALRDSDDYERAAETMRRVCAESPGEPVYRLDLAGDLDDAGHTEEARTIYEDIADNGKLSSAVRSRAYRQRAAMAARAGDLDAAVAHLDSAAALPVPENERRLIVTLRHVALSHWPSAPILRQLFWDSPKEDMAGRIGILATAIAADPTAGLPYYLLGRYRRDHGDPSHSTAALSKALELGLPHPLLTQECARLLAIESYRAGDYEKTLEAARLLEASPNPVLALYGADWKERVHWKRHGTLPAHDRPLP